MEQPDQKEPNSVPFTLAPEVAKAVNEAQAEIGRVLQLSEMRADPLRHPLNALSMHLGALYKLMLDSTLKLGTMIKPPPPISRDDITRISQEAAKGAAVAAMALERGYRLRTMLCTSVALVGLIMAGSYGGVWFGYRWGVADTEIFRSMDADEAHEWIVLMRANTSVLKSVGECGKSARMITAPDSRKACEVPLYLSPPVFSG